MDMMEPEDKNLYEKWYASIYETEILVQRGLCEDSFIVNELVDVA